MRRCSASKDQGKGLEAAGSRQEGAPGVRCQGKSRGPGVRGLEPEEVREETAQPGEISQDT